jgi:long-chain acyl-CoA synthetase
MNVAASLERAAFFFPDRPVLSCLKKELTYAELNEKTGLLAAALLEMGLKAGERVVLCAANSPEWVIAYFGILKAGGVAVTLSSLLSFDELSLLVNHAGPRFAFTDNVQGFKGLGAPLEAIVGPGGDTDLSGLIDRAPGRVKSVDRLRTDVAAILYTGGTTGTPKGVMLTHENINLSAQNVAFVERSTEHDRALCFLPLHHVFGQVHIMLGTVASAGSLEFLSSFDMDLALEILAENRVTKFFSVPTIYVRLSGLPSLREKLGAVRYCFSSASSLPAEIIRQWKAATGITISEGYGMTESASAVTYNHYYLQRETSVGQTVPGVEVEIRDASGKRLKEGEEGEICVNGRNIMKGYLDNPSETEAAFWPDGWFRSGDIGVLDEDRYLFIVDRLKDLIITGGENVYPREIEEALYQRPEVQECSVVGLPDQQWGERVVAFIVPKEGEAVSGTELKSFLKARLSPYKVPKEYVVLKELPKGSTGKILKRELKNTFGHSG